MDSQESPLGGSFSDSGEGMQNFFGDMPEQEQKEFLEALQTASRQALLELPEEGREAAGYTATMNHLGPVIKAVRDMKDASFYQGAIQACMVSALSIQGMHYSKDRMKLPRAHGESVLEALVQELITRVDEHYTANGIPKVSLEE